MQRWGREPCRKHPTHLLGRGSSLYNVYFATYPSSSSITCEQSKGKGQIHRIPLCSFMFDAKTFICVSWLVWIETCLLWVSSSRNFRECPWIRLQAWPTWMCQFLAMYMSIVMVQHRKASFVGIVQYAILSLCCSACASGSSSTLHLRHLFHFVLGQFCRLYWMKV